MTTHIAAEQIMKDLIDCLLAEDFFGPLQLQSIQEWQTTQTFFSALKSHDYKVWQWYYDIPQKHSLVALLQPGLTQAWERVPNTVVLDGQAGQYTEVTPADFLKKALEGVAERYQGNEKGLALFQEVLGISQHQTELSQAHCIESDHLLAKDNAAFFLAMEQWASLRDRPYHPLAKAKHGLSDEEYQAYQAEFNQPVTLNWVAVRKDWLQVGQGVTALEAQTPQHYLLPNEEAEKLNKELQLKGLLSSHIGVPVHPWQFNHALEKHLSEPFAQGHCHRLNYSCPNFFATSSLRSMTPCFDSPHHLKLPMAIYSLGASRYLPAVKMINGGFSEALLKQSQTLDKRLQSRLYLCDETKWWAFMPPEATLFDDAPRHLSAMVRTYPNVLLQDQNIRLIPMAALGTPLPQSKDHFFNEWLGYRQLDKTPESITKLFREVCSCFFEINLRMFKLGMLAEVHGQNAVLVWKQGKAHGLLLRDHDSLRIYVPWLERQGLSDPNYCIKKGHANTLYHDHPEDLLFWLQTLGIQVNMRSIIETISIVYDLPQSSLWSIMKEEIQKQIEQIDFNSATKTMIQEVLFDCPTWPQKHLLSPMIDRAGGPGSMPFGKGEVVNPFQQCNEI